MNKKILLILLMVSTSFISTCFANGYKITGKILGDTEGKKVYLYAGNDIVLSERSPNVKLLDSTVIKNNMFEFNGVLETPEMLNISILVQERAQSHPVIPIFIDNETINIEAVLEDIPTHNMYANYDLSKIKVSGSSVNDLFWYYLKEKNSFSQKQLEARKEYNMYFFSNQGKISDKIKAVEKIDAVNDELKVFMTELIKQNKDNYAGMYIFNDNKNLYSVNELDELIAVFPSQMKNSKYGEKVTKQINATKQSSLGAQYIDFTLNDNNGNEVKLSDYVGKGKYVLLEFWASWCGPCVQEIPHLKEVYELYNPKGFEIISISLDTEEDKWKAAMEKYEMPWLQVSDLKGFGELSNAYNFRGIPTCILVSPEGKIVDRNMRGSWMDKKLIELYGNEFGERY